jgi:hypothetical protein
MKKQEGKQAVYKCPVCGGKGIVPGRFYDGTGYIDEYGSKTWTGGYNTEACRACGGTGIIWGRQK